MFTLSMLNKGFYSAMRVIAKLLIAGEHFNHGQLDAHELAHGHHGR